MKYVPKTNQIHPIDDSDRHRENQRDYADKLHIVRALERIIGKQITARDRQFAELKRYGRCDNVAKYVR